jgi:hypothetical protein
MRSSWWLADRPTQGKSRPSAHLAGAVTRWRAVLGNYGRARERRRRLGLARQAATTLARVGLNQIVAVGAKLSRAVSLDLRSVLARGASARVAIERIADIVEPLGKAAGLALVRAAVRLSLAVPRGAAGRVATNGIGAVGRRRAFLRNHSRARERLRLAGEAAAARIRVGLNQIVAIGAVLTRAVSLDLRSILAQGTGARVAVQRIANVVEPLGKAARGRRRARAAQIAAAVGRGLILPRRTRGRWAAHARRAVGIWRAAFGNLCWARGHGVRTKQRNHKTNQHLWPKVILRDEKKKKRKKKKRKTKEKKERNVRKSIK